MALDDRQLLKAFETVGAAGGLTIVHSAHLFFTTKNTETFEFFVVYQLL